MAEAQSSVRGSMSEAIREEFSPEYLRELAAEVKNATTGVWVEVDCKHCGRLSKALARVKDLDRVVKMTMEMLEQAEGRPGTQSVEDAGVTLVVERRWPGAGAPDPVDVRAAS